MQNSLFYIISCLISSIAVLVILDSILGSCIVKGLGNSKEHFLTIKSLQSMGFHTKPPIVLMIAVC